MACISGVEVGKYPHSPGCRPYLSRKKRLGTIARLVVISEKSPFSCSLIVQAWRKTLVFRHA